MNTQANELVKLILDKSKALGYRFKWLSLDSEKHCIIKSEEALNDLPEDLDNFIVMTVDSGTNLDEAEAIVINFKNMTIMKKLSDRTTTRYFTNEELKFFNSLGFKTSDFHKKYTEQVIEDWS